MLHRSSLSTTFDSAQQRRPCRPARAAPDAAGPPQSLASPAACSRFHADSYTSSLPMSGRTTAATRRRWALPRKGSATAHSSPLTRRSVSRMKEDSEV